MIRPVGVVLAGGRATRMGGGQKALKDLAGRPLLAHVLDRLRGQVDTVAINANAEFSAYAPFGHDVIRDDIEGFPGPLAGILAGMRWAASKGHDHIVTVAADTPFFPSDLVEKLASGDGKINLAASPDPQKGLMRHPTFGVWPTALADDLETALKDGTRKIVAWADQHGVASVAFEAKGFDPFFNVNTPDDMLKAEAYLAEFSL